MRFIKLALIPALMGAAALAACGGEREVDEVGEVEGVAETPAVAPATTAPAAFDPALDVDRDGILDAEEGMGDADQDGVLDRDEVYTPVP